VGIGKLADGRSVEMGCKRCLPSSGGSTLRAPMGCCIATELSIAITKEIKTICC
jgi:hypothetical protein